ncbi:DUF559 domain-containing protein [Actinoplanes sp. NPDC023714]|uniref:DUF559 domain-containing protein n=1 Tax=Actinoplanes sp. NPDC023714 TaxID=3154322 RepID=UPI0033CA5299
MRREEDPHLVALLRRQSHVISRKQALRHLTARMVERRLTSGRWQSAHRGVYVAHSGPIGRQSRRWVASLSCGAGRPALLGGLSALEDAGFRGFPTEPIHVLAPARMTPGPIPEDVVLHRTSRLPGTDIHLRGTPPCTRPARSLVDAAQWQTSERTAWAVIAAGFQQRLVSAEDLTRVLAGMPRARHRAAIAEAARWAAGGVHSAAEADFLRLCRRARLPEPALQRPRRRLGERVNYLDAYFKGYGVHVEIDGGQHMEVQQYWADMRRQNELWIPGERVLRFAAWALRHEPDVVIAQLRAALYAARPDRPPNDPLRF